uniref:SFRICE_012904 n=1 Tax=Spodoptera frugiperda TaxID=7108 RepID=A0A2H1WMY3_SPOFR
MLKTKTFATRTPPVAGAGAEADIGSPSPQAPPVLSKIKSVNILESVDYTDQAPGPGLSPLDFDKFIPWVCKQWCASTAILITRKTQETPVRKSLTKTKSKVLFGQGSKPKSIVSEDISSPTSIVNNEPKNNLLVYGEEVVPITTYYDIKKRLIEIAFLECQVNVSRKVIHAISLSLPYHAMMTRFTFRRSRLTDILIYEINKLLPISNITEVCFDDSYVKEGNYYILLEQFSQLRYLSLNRCCINDAVCKKIFTNIDFEAPAATSLQLLELGSNDITDEGAKFIGHVLRKNRCLLYLNLSGNKITDEGFRPIIESLMEFPLEPEEVLSMRRRKMRYLQNKMCVYARCLTELKYGKSSTPTEDIDSSSSGKKHQKHTPKFTERRRRKTLVHQSVADTAEAMARGIVGDFEDPFAPENLVYKGDNEAYSMGNLTLCYLNMAYNNLELPSVQRIKEALTYQESVAKGRREAGLIRVILDGNYIPEKCDELEEIDLCLTKVLIMKSLGRKPRRLSSVRRMYSYVKSNVLVEDPI